MGYQDRVVRAMVFVLVSLCVFAKSTPAQDCPELVGSLPWGGADKVAVSGDYVYFNAGDSLRIANVSDPMSPQLLGHIVLPGEVSAIEVSGSYAFVTGCQDGLRVIDVSTPSTPVEVGFLEMPCAVDVEIDGGYAYVADELGGFCVIDVSTPSALIEVGHTSNPAGPANGLEVLGGYAYVTCGDFFYGSGYPGLQVIDISIPSAPTAIGWLEFDSYPNPENVAVTGDHAYVTWEGELGLSVIDVSTPSAPVEVGSVEIPEICDPRDVEVAASGSYAYLAAGRLCGPLVIDVSEPSDPVEVALVEPPYSAYDVAISGGYAYVAAGWEGLALIDMSTPSAPVAVGSVFSAWSIHDVAVSGDYAYGADYGEGLRVIDVSTPHAPAEVGFLDTSASHVAVSGGYAYLTWSDSGVDQGLRVIDVSTPHAPVDVGVFQMRYTSPKSVAVSGGYAFVACYTSGSYSGGLWVIDVTSPSSPLEVAFLGTEDHQTDVAAAGDYAFVTLTNVYYDEGGLSVIDVSTPSAPVEVGWIDIPAPAQGVSVEGDYAYVLWGQPYGEAVLSVIDVNTPSAPVEVGSVTLSPPGLGYRSSFAVSHGFAYVSVTRGLLVIDVSIPSAPVEVGYHDRNRGAVAVSGGHVFLAGAGLFIYNECSDPAADARECFIPAAAVAAGVEGSFFQTDVELNNNGAEAAEVFLQWLPRGENNSEPVSSEAFTVAPGASLRFDNVLTEVFDLEPDSLGALNLVANTESVIGMSRTYNVSGAKAAGTFGQGLPAIRATEMIMGTDPQRIIFLSEDDESRVNVGCLNGSSDPVSIHVGIFDDEGSPLETKTLDLGPWSNDQLNQVLDDWAPVNGYIDVWGHSDDALFTCYGSVLDNLTSDPTTVLPQVPSDETTFIPAAALAAGLEGSFFTTDVDLNNVGSDDITYELLWLPRGADNSAPTRSDTFSLAAGSGVRYANVLGEVFGLEPDQVGALAIEASGIDLLAMSRTYNIPSGDAVGTFGQGLPGVPADQMIPTGVTKRIIFMSEDDDFRGNLGCVNGADAEVVVAIDLYDSDGAKLETRYMVLPPYSNWQFNRIFQDSAPVNGYVEVQTHTPDAAFTCYGSVLDDLTSDPTTVLPQ